MSDTRSITPISGSEPCDFQVPASSWLGDQYPEIDFYNFTDLTPISTSTLDSAGGNWFLGLTPVDVSDLPHLPSPAQSVCSTSEEVTRPASNSGDAVDDVTVKAPRNAPRKRPGRYKNAPAHILNRRREQCRVAQQKHRERKDNRIVQLEKELKSLQEEYQTVLNNYMLLDKAYTTFVAEVSATLVKGSAHVSGLPIGAVDTEAAEAVLSHMKLFSTDIGL